ncbi:MAG: reprolysin-like metallopeptidase [Saprospiraceae bacterium]
MAALLSVSTSLFGQELSADFSSLQVHATTRSGPVEIALDEAQLLSNVKSAPQRFSRNGQAPKEVELPGPDGIVESFQLERVQTMHPDLQAKYPQIMAFAGWKSDDPTMHVRAEFSPEQGWTISYRPANAERVAIRPKQTASGRAYERVKLSDVAPQNFTCLNDDEAIELDEEEAVNPNYQAMRAGDCQLRKYRTAISCTGEYAQAVGGSSPTTTSVLAAMNTAVNRLNEVYERDMGITLELIARNDELIYFNGATDPYTNGSAGLMINESQATIDAVVGSAVYDLGHLFGTAGAGLAQLRSVCGNSKARGITGIGNPTGDFFYIDYVAHEIGHQFGATHTFYNSCSGNRTQATAFEPGSGSTIMAYAGICAPNVQNRSSDLFHAASLAQMSAFVTGSGHTCPAITNTSNSSPSVSLPQATYTIPISTPFELIADATDPDGTSLTYTWEQYDNDLGGAMPPVSTNAVGPMFLALNVSPDPRRRFPSGNNPTYEVLPSVARDMDFRVTVRDNDSRYGCTAEADLTVTTAGTTPFEITNYTTAATLEGLSTYTVEWNVAGTNAAPFNTPLVNIYLSLDGGYTYDYNLADMVPNDGSADVTLPNINTTTARFVVKGHDNVFLDVNDANLTIQEPVIATFSMTSATTSGASCAGADVTFPLDIGSVLGFNESVTLAAANLPTGATASFTNNGQSGMFSSVMTISGLSAVPNGTYTFEVIGNANGQQRSLSFVLEVKQVPSGAGMAVTPLDGGDEGLVFTSVTWGYDASIGSIRFELSGDPTFQAGVFSQLFDQAAINLSGIATGIYFWRVAYENECGRGPWSELRSFRKIPLDEEAFNSTGSTTIGGGNPGTYSNTINVPRQGEVYQVEFTTAITHSYVGDLDADVNLPASLDIELFGRPSGGGCRSQNIAATFADDATNTAAAFVATCTNNIPSISGTFQPVNQVYTALPREGSGDYTINVTDNESADGGSIASWDVTLWYADIPEFNETRSTDTVRVAVNGTAVVANSNLSFFAATVDPAQAVYVLKVLPIEGELQRNGASLGLGSIFSQSDINSNNVTYVHSAISTTGFDDFTVDLILPGAGYFANTKVPVRISMNNLTLTGAVTGTILCAGETTASISVNPSGGSQPFMYRLDNGAFQISPNFSGLGAGTYSVTVRDVNGLEFTLTSIVITEPNALTLSASASGPSINALGAGGTSPYTYSIGGAFQSSGNFTNLADDTYLVTVRDANGCETDLAVIVAASNLSVTLSVEVPIFCNGDLGILLAAASDGVPPYMYSLNNGPQQTDNLFSNLSEGTYTVIVTDALGNRANSTTASLVEPEVLTATATAASNTITVTPAGGTPGYTYSIRGGASQSSNVFTGLANGAYTIEVTDANGCSTTAQATVNVNQLSVALQVVTEILCNGELATLRANVAGGPAPYSFSLNNGPAQSSPDFNNVPAGSYTVVVTDGDGNMATSAQVEVTEPAILVVIASVSGNTITATSGGGANPYQYSLDGSNFQPSNVFTGIGAGTYTLTIVDANGCTASTSVTVTSSNFTASLSILEPVICNGATGALQGSATGGTMPYMYSLNNGPAQTSPNFSVVAGVYTLTVTDATGSMAISTQFTLTEPLSLTAAASVAGTTVTVTASGGSAPYMYQLASGAFQSSEVFTGVNPGTYTITVIDANACSTTTSVTVGGNGTLAVGVTFNLGQESCPGAGDGAVTLVGANGQAPYEYSLDGTNFQSGTFFDNLAAGNYTATVRDATGARATSTFDILARQVPMVDATVEGSRVTFSNFTPATSGVEYSFDGGATFSSSPVGYFYVVGSQNILIRYGSCQFTQTVAIANPLRLDATDIVICADGTVNPSVVCALGGSGGLNVRTSAGTITAQANSNCTGGDGYVVFPPTGVSFIDISVVDAVGASVVQTVPVVSAPSFTVGGTFDAGTLTTTVSGGTAPFTYSIDGGTTTQTDPVFTGLDGTSYTVTVTDAYGCSVDETFLISGTGDLTEQFGLQVFPNPMNDWLQVTVSANVQVDHLMIVDATGRTVLVDATPRNMRLDVSNLAPGFYTLIVESPEGRAHVAVVRQ